MSDAKTNRNIVVVPFSPQWQKNAQTLILAGLEEHLGRLDPTKNPDLKDIAAAYADGVFLLAVRDGVLVGTGAIVPEGEGTMRIVRMSVARDERRGGIGRAVLQVLLQRARNLGCKRLVCETTDTWRDAIGFYLKHGFQIVGHAEGEIHFVRDIGDDEL